MQSLFLTVTHRCERRCEYCFERAIGIDDAREELPAASLASIATSLIDPGGVAILTGGEPLIRPDLEELISRLRRHGIRCLLLTNGDRLDEPRIECLVRAGLDAVSLSAPDLTTEHDHDQARATIERLSLTVGRLFNGGLHAVSLIYLISAVSARWLPGVPRALPGSDRGFPGVPRALPAGILPQPVCRARGQTAPAPHSPSRLTRAEWGAIWRLCGIPVQARYPRLVESLFHPPTLKPSRCRMGAATAVLDSDGEIHPCFHRRDLPCGNAATDPIDSIQTRLTAAAESISPAPCYGEHCVSLFTG